MKNVDERRRNFMCERTLPSRLVRLLNSMNANFAANPSTIGRKMKSYDYFLAIIDRLKKVLIKKRLRKTIPGKLITIVSFFNFENFSIRNLQVMKYRVMKLKGAEIFFH